MRIWKWLEIILALFVVFFFSKLMIYVFETPHLYWHDTELGLHLFWQLLSLGLLGLTHFRKQIFKPKNMISCALVLGSLIFAVLIFELVMAPFNMVFNAANLHGVNFNKVKEKAQKNPDKKTTLQARRFWWAQDKELGYKPLMGPNYAYSKLGALHNDLDPKKPENKTRVLFIGDSITAYGFTEDAIAKLYKDASYEYWNTGVWGYATWQELGYFERYGRKLKPDVVILGFCLNDWDGTPVLLKDENGDVAMANMHVGQEYFNYWLFKHSTIYRIFISVLASLTDRAGLEENVIRGLNKIKEYSKKDGFAFRVIVYPELEHRNKWEKGFVKQHQKILNILTKLDIPYYDTAPLLEKSLQGKKRDWARMAPDDHFHPSRIFSKEIAKQIIAQGFLKPLPQ